MGDVAGIGPEVIVRALQDRRLQRCCDPVVVGHPEVLARAMRLVEAPFEVVSVDTADRAGTLDATHRGESGASGDRRIACWNPGPAGAAQVPAGLNDARGGRAAYAYLHAAATRTLAGDFDAVTTAPLSKAALHLAGFHYPGHTEILADLCGGDEFAMMLYLAHGPELPAGGAVSRVAPHGSRSDEFPPDTAADLPERGLGVAHVTLHTSIRSVPDLLSQSAIFSKITLVDGFLRNLGQPLPRVGVCALNPHAGEAGLFGDEESRLIAPAVEQAQAAGIAAAGPFPADTLLKRACEGEFDGVVAMYHDQGHIALKLVGFGRAVNVTLGLPLIRTSPSHGTAFDIAWKGVASGAGMLEAVCLAARLADRRHARQDASA